MPLPHFATKKRNFKNCGPYRWEITDKYGDILTDDIVRDNTINEVLCDNLSSLDILYTIGLRKKDEGGWGMYNIVFESKCQLLKLYPLSDGDVRVNLICKSLQECEGLVDMLCIGNDMEVQPAYLCR